MLNLNGCCYNVIVKEGKVMGNNTLDKFGDKIYDLRKQKNLSQDELAEKVGVSRQTVSKWEADIIQPKADKLQRICNALEVELNYFSFKDNMIDEPYVISAESDDSKAVVCDIVQQEEYLYEEKSNKKALLKIRKKLIIAIVIFNFFLIGISIIMYAVVNNAPEKDGSFDDGFRSTTWNCNLENIGWIVFGISIGIVVLLGLAMIWYSIKIKK